MNRESESGKYQSNSGLCCSDLVMPRNLDATSFTTRYDNTCEVLLTINDREVVSTWRNW